MDWRAAPRIYQKGSHAAWVMPCFDRLFSLGDPMLDSAFLLQSPRQQDRITVGPRLGLDSGSIPGVLFLQLLDASLIQSSNLSHPQCTITDISVCPWAGLWLGTWLGGYRLRRLGSHEWTMVAGCGLYQRSPCVYDGWAVYLCEALE